MKKILLPILSLILAACSSSQVAVTRSAQVTVTSSPPTATPIPTPTLHPQFVKLQTQVAASGERFTLAPDGTIQDGAITVPGLSVDKNGTITLQGDSLPAQAGSQVTISPEDVSFDDEKGVNVKGYTLDKATGKWGVNESKAVLQTRADFEKYGYDLTGYEIVENENGVVIIDPETSKEIYKNGEFSLNYAVLNATDLVATNYQPKAESRVGFPNRPTDYTTNEYVFPIVKQVRNQMLDRFNINPSITKNSYDSARVLL